MHPMEEYDKHCHRKGTVLLRGVQVTLLGNL